VWLLCYCPKNFQHSLLPAQWKSSSLVCHLSKVLLGRTAWSCLHFLFCFPPQYYTHTGLHLHVFFLVVSSVTLCPKTLGIWDYSWHLIGTFITRAEKDADWLHLGSSPPQVGPFLQPEGELSFLERSWCLVSISCGLDPFLHGIVVILFLFRILQTGSGARFRSGWAG
jgi:hypothetical protein